MKHRKIVWSLPLLLAGVFYFYKNLEQEKDNRVNDPNYYKVMSPLLFRNQDRYYNRFTCGTMMNFHPKANGESYVIFHSFENLKITLPDKIQDKLIRESKDHLQLDSSYSDSLMIEKPKAESYSSDSLPSIQESQ